MSKKIPAIIPLTVPTGSAAAPSSRSVQRQRAADLRSTVAALRQGSGPPSSPRQFTDLAAEDAAALAAAKRVRPAVTKQAATEQATVKPVRKR